MILSLDNENSQGAVVFPEEAGSAAETAGSEEANNESTGDEVGSAGSKAFFAKFGVKFGNTLVLAIIALGYPVAVLPYYRADSTTE